MNQMASITYLEEPGGRQTGACQVPVGTALRDTVRKPKGLQICRLNGGPKYLSQKDWGYRLRPHDTVEWIDYPAGGDDDGPGLLQLVVAFAVAIGSQNPYPILLAFATTALTWMLDKPQTTEVEGLSPTYATGLQGNQARLYSVVPKICGRHQSFPPFASQPYQEFDANGEQYLYVLLALGIGNHEIERVLIDDTDINHFSDVLTATYLPPGTQPTAVRANVINSPEVAGQDMLTGEYIGGFSACGPRALAASISIDIAAPQGLGLQDSSGNVGSLEVRWRVEIRSLNEFGSALTPWSVLANETRTAADREPQRWTSTYVLSSPIRPEIRIVRVDVKSSNARALNDLTWTGMRAYLQDAAPLNPAVAHFEVVMRASKQLSGVSQNRISVIATGMCRELLSDLTFGAEIATRNPAHWLADLWTSTTWGEGLDESEVDLQTLYDLSVIWAERQDRFDYIFDTAVDADTAAQIIAEAGRARCFRRGGVRTLARDQLTTLPRTAFTTRNTLPGSMSFKEELPRDDTPDGVIMEYFDNRAWDFGRPIECPCPGVVTMQRPVRIRKAGITGRIHATREGLFEAAKIALRRQSVEAIAEMPGSLPTFGSLVRWQSEVSRWQSGDVVDWDVDTLTMRITEPPSWGSADKYIVLIRDDGTPTDPIRVLPGALTTEVLLDSAPDFTPTTEDGTRDRTQYLLGGLDDDEMLVKVNGIEDGGSQDGAALYKISAFVDDARIHAADNAYLPSPGEIQDPIDTSPGDDGGGTSPVVNLTNLTLIGVSTSSGAAASYTLRNDGTAHAYYTGDLSGSLDADVEEQWLYVQPVEVSVTEQFEVRATVIYIVGSITGPAFDVWHSLDTTRVWEAVPGSTSDGARIRFEIRDVATLTVQDSALIDLGAQNVST